jgi:hypothetical protein
MCTVDGRRLHYGYAIVADQDVFGKKTQRLLSAAFQISADNQYFVRSL